MNAKSLLKNEILEIKKNKISKEVTGAIAGAVIGMSGGTLGMGLGGYIGYQWAGLRVDKKIEKKQRELERLMR